MARRTLALAATTFLIFTFAPPASAAWQVRTLGKLRWDVCTEINRVRVEHGLVPLRPAGSLAAAARQHVYEMAVLGYFGHSSPNRPSFAYRLALYYSPRGNGWHVGENLLWWAAPINPGTVVQLWLASLSHRRELLDPSFREFGVSAAVVEDAVGIFGRRRVTLISADFGVRG